MGAIVTPQYVRELAVLLDAKDTAEWALPYALASAPLPEGWTYLIADNGNVSFVHDDRPQAPQREHPLLDRANQALVRLRAAGSASGGGGGGANPRLLGPFENLDSPAIEYFYVDVETGAQVPEYECPPGSVIPALPPDVLQLLLFSPSSPFSSSGAQRQQQEPQQQQQEEEQEGGEGEGEGSQPVSPATPAGMDAARGEAANGDAGVSTRGAAPPAEGPGDGSSLLGSRAGSRPQSAASTASRSAAGGGAPATSRPGPSSPSAAPKPPSREGSGRSVGAGAAANGTAPAAVAAVAAVAAAAAGGARLGSTSGAGRRGSDVSGVAGEASRGSVVAVDAASPSSPQPSPPAPPAAAAAAASVAAAAAGAPRSTSSGLPADEYDEVDDDSAAAYRRDACTTTAGYAGSASESGSGNGNRSSDGSGRRGSGGSAAGSGGVGGNGAAGESLSSSDSARSGASSTTRGGAAGGIGLRPPVAPPSGRLTFYGWWFEDIESADLTFRLDSKPQAGGGLAPRHCTLVYDFSMASYNFTMRDPVTPPAPGQPYERVPELTVPGIGGDQVAMIDTGRPTDPWDLHLGARLRVLGRQVVLKNSDLATAQWHAGYFRQLCALRDKLSVEVQKYKPRVLRPVLVCDKGDVRLQTGQQLRHVALAVRELIEDLRQYRPAKAESFLAALPIQF